MFKNQNDFITFFYPFYVKIALGILFAETGIIQSNVSQAFAVFPTHTMNMKFIV
jgi:hypothetical protein